MTYFFHRKFSLPEGELGTIFFVTSSIAAASMLVASSIAKRIGNVKVSISRISDMQRENYQTSNMMLFRKSFTY